jgi:hypothetical protein
MNGVLEVKIKEESFVEWSLPMLWQIIKGISILPF